MLQRNFIGRETSATRNDETGEQESTSHVLGYVEWKIKKEELYIYIKHDPRYFMVHEADNLSSFVGADDVPPPKPSRQPQNTTDQSQLTAAAPVSTYIVAQNPEVLAQLLKDNQTRGVCPSVYTTPASPFNTLAVQFQDEDQVLTTALVSDLPFFDHPTTSEPPPASHETHSGDSTLSDTNLDSLDSSDAPLMSSLNISDATQAQSPAANRKQQKVKEMQNLYAVSSKVVGSITGDLYSPVQKFTTSGAIPITTSVATCGEIYGPVANFTQSSAIVGNLSQSPSVGGNFGENPGNFGPGSLNSIVGLNNQNQLSNFAQFSVNNTSQNSNCIQQNPTTAVVYPRIPVVTSSNAAIPASNAECLYGPVLKFRAQNIQNQNVTDLKSVNVSVGTTMANVRGNLAHTSTPGANLQTRPAHAQNYQHQQIYSNISTPQPMYVPQSQNAQSNQKQNPIHQSVSYMHNTSQHTNQQNQAIGANPIYTAQATSVTVVQAQKVQGPVYVQQIQSGITSHAPSSQAMNQQQLSFEIAQSHPIQVHFATSGGTVQPTGQQHLHPSTSNIVIGQQSTSITATQHSQAQCNVANLPITAATNATQQYLVQPIVQSGMIRSATPQIATGVAKITTFVNQKQDEQLTSSTDGTLSGSLISSAVSDSTMSSSSSMTEEAQQDQVCQRLPRNENRILYLQQHIVFIYNSKFLQHHTFVAIQIIYIYINIYNTQIHTYTYIYIYIHT